MPDYTREMFPIQVTHKGGRVVLIQPDPMGNDDVVIDLAPAQVPIVSAWMFEATKVTNAEGK